MSTQQFTLPDLLAVCPFEGSTNPHYTKVGAESRAWINSNHVFQGRKLALFNKAVIELLASHAYPQAGSDQFRTCCDFVNLLFVIDELSDDQDGKGARHTGEVFLSAMRYADWDDGSALAKMTREFKQRLLKHAGPRCYQRFLTHFADYVNAVTREAELRERGEVLDTASFQTLRRENSAVNLAFDLFELNFGFDLPDAVFQDEHFMKMYWAAIDMICWSNDVYSYNMEQAKGLMAANIVTVLMHEKNIELQAASDLIGKHFSQLVDQFVEAKRHLPSICGGSVDTAVAKYVAAMEQWVIGSLLWSFESQRYFGEEHRRVKETRVVVLSRKHCGQS